MNEMASPEQLAADSRPEEDDFSLEDEMEMARDFNDEQDAIFGKPNFVEEEGLEEMARTSNVFKLSQEASMKDVLQFMQRVNDVLKTYKSPGQKRPKKRFTPEEMKTLATAMLKPEGFTSKDVIAATSYNSPAQANKFLKALEMKGLITLTSQLKKAMEPTRDPNAPETRGRKRRDAEFDMSDDPMADLDALGLGGNIDLSDPLAEISMKTFASAFNKALERGEVKRAENLSNTFFRNFIGQEFSFGKITDIELLQFDGLSMVMGRDGTMKPTRGGKAGVGGVKIQVDVTSGKNLVTGGSMPYLIRYDIQPDRITTKSITKQTDTGIEMVPIERRDARLIQKIVTTIYPGTKYATGTEGFNIKGLRENNNTMSELEKYIKKVIKEAKNPLAKKMKEIENQGRRAALETKLAAIDEMIEETEGRLTRIDEDNEFRDMMDKNAVKEVRKQLKELERAKAKLQKEYGKMKKMALPKNYDEDEKGKVMDEEAPVAEDAIDAAIDEVELEEDNFELNESVKRMQKLANLKG
jgi:hypothetical protein